MKNKYEFIVEMLRDPRVKPNDKERLIALSAKEFGGIEELEERVKKLEKQGFGIKTPASFKPLAKGEVNDISTVEISQDMWNTIGMIEQRIPAGNKIKNEGLVDKPESDPHLPAYIDPVNLYRFLFAYNQNPILKTTCHDVGSEELNAINEFCGAPEYNFENHLACIKAEFERLGASYHLPRTIKPLIRGYLTGKDYQGNDINGWSTDRIKMNWSHPDLLGWSQSNPAVPPHINEGFMEVLSNEGFEFQGIYSKITGKLIQDFRELTIHFKNLFHVRFDNSLVDLIRLKNNEEGWNELIEFRIDDTSFPRNVEHFTDVDKVLQAYKELIKLIKRVSSGSADNRAKVKLSIREQDGSFQFSIWHINSEYKKSIRNTEERLGDTYSLLVAKQLNGLCNFHVNANFGNGEFAKVNIWDGKTREASKIAPMEGVEHVMVFPKN